MIKIFYKLFNHDKIDDLNKTIDTYRERNAQLEKEINEYKGYKLKYQVAMLQIEDEEGFLELLEYASKRDRDARISQDCLREGARGIAALQQQAMNAMQSSHHQRPLYGDGILGGLL